jgi:hypothetical protein
MARRRRLSVSFAVTTALVASLAFVAPALAGPRVQATLTGAEEVPGPGDPDGSGTAVIRLNKSKGEICYELSVSDISPAVAAHIHIGSAGVAGPVVVPLGAPVTGSSSGCATVTPDLIKTISKSPADYYVNVHTADFPAGAVRGQLSK